MSEARRANGVAAVVILLAGALSTVWAFIVPMFQAPDEPAHFDYAVSIYTARHLIALSDGTPDWIVSPYTKYLLRASDFDRIAWHSSMRVPPGYGSKPYFARVDAFAPHVAPSSSFGGRISYIVPLYPFGFYALEALWMRAVSYFTGSTVAIFFAARLLCVLLMMVGLYFNYRTAINLGVPAWVSVALTAAVGLFPLTSFVSSYVQPDNLAFTLVSAALFFATQLRRDPLRVSDVAGVALSLGFLAVTKYQFFISVAVPTALLLAVRLGQTASARQRLTGAVIFVTPAAALLAMQRWIVDHSTGATAPTAINTDSLREVVTGGVGATLHYLAVTGASAVIDCFATGACAMTFWQVVGWFDTPIVIINTSVEIGLRAIIALASIIVLVVLAYRIARSAVRLCRVIPRRHSAAAWRIASADPVLNAYLCFIAIMVALYVLSDNAFGAEGRQFYPYVFPAFLCFVWYAPRALQRRHRTVTTVFTAILLGYVLVAAGYALADVHQRYYGQPLPGYVATDPGRSEISSRNAGVLWPVTPAAYHVDGLTYPSTFTKGPRLHIGGLTILPEDGVVPSTVAVVVDSHLPVPVLADQYLAHFAEASRGAGNGYGAFYATIQTAQLAEGAHTVAAYAQRVHDGGYDTIEPLRLFFLTGRGGRFSPAALHALDNAPVAAGSVAIRGTCRGALSLAHAMPEVAAGSALVVGGRVWAGQRAAWLLADGRPYPARYDRANGSYTGTIPTASLSPGNHVVAAYAIARDGRSYRLSQRTEFRVLSDRGRNEFAASPPAACRDPLRQLAGMDT
jgi:hypothetical protein